jgi:hypothetical protein
MAGATPTPTTTDPNAVPNGGTIPTATPATTDPATVTATPAATTTDPNAAIGATPATTPITDGTDFNAPIGGGTAAPVTDPTATAGAVAAAPTGALVGGPTAAPAPQEQVVVPEAAEEEAPVEETPSVPDTLPPAPPQDWKALPVDTEIIFGLALDGPYLAPWTKSKSWVFTNVSRKLLIKYIDRYS